MANDLWKNNEWKRRLGNTVLLSIKLDIRFSDFPIPSIDLLWQMVAFHLKFFCHIPDEYSVCILIESPAVKRADLL